MVEKYFLAEITNGNLDAGRTCSHTLPGDNYLWLTDFTLGFKHKEGVL